MSRLAATFDDLGARSGKGLVAYVTAGDPDQARSEAVVRGAVRGGADVIELGVPFSDPIADGPAIQRATERSLAAGGSLTRTLDLVHALRADLDVPIVLFTYVNPVLRYGVPAFVAKAADAGVDGVLLLDLPIEESAPLQSALASRGIDPIFLISPTTTPERLAEAARLGRGFLYAISRVGVTGARETVASTAEPLARRIRAASTLPIALGFGISRPEHVADVTAFADAAVVGSAIVETVAGAVEAGRDPGVAVETFVRWLKGG